MQSTTKELQINYKIFRIINNRLDNTIDLLYVFLSFLCSYNIYMEEMKMLDEATIVKAWKSPEFRATLSEEEKNQLPEHPSGAPVLELDIDQLTGVVGGDHLSCLGAECWSNENSCGWICTWTDECNCRPDTCSCSTWHCYCYGFC